MPALLVMVCAGVVIASGVLVEDRRVRQQYLAAAEDAFNSAAYSRARLHFQRAIQEGETSGESLFKLARCCEELKDFPAMEAIISQLAPLETNPSTTHTSYAPAHLRQAARLLQSTPMTEQALNNAKQHLLTVVRLDNKNETAHRLLGEIYFQQSDWSEAIAQFKQILAGRPEYNLAISKAYTQLNDSRAIGFAQEGREIFVRRISIDPGIVDNYWHAADGCMLLGDFQQAADYLTKGLELQPDNTMLQYGLGRAYVRWGASLRGETRQERAIQLELFSRALTINPDEFLVYDGLLLILRAKDETSLQAEEFLKGHLAEGKSVGLCHMLLSSLAESRGDMAQCELHLSRAFDLMPQAAIVANNLAWVLAMKDDPEPERALVLINRAVEQAPTATRLLDTRGQIHVLLGNWQEAVGDLERTMPEFANNPKTHEALAQCYEQLGDKLLAEQHRRLAQPGQTPSGTTAPPATETKETLPLPPPAEKDEASPPETPATPGQPRI